MFCPICKSFFSALDDECKVCGKIFKRKKKSKKLGKSNVKSKNNKSEKKSNGSKKRKNKNKKNKISSEIRKNMSLGGKTRKYNDRRNFEFSVLGCYTIW